MLRLAGIVSAYFLGVLTVAAVCALWVRSSLQVPVLLERIPPGEPFYLWLVERTSLATGILVAEAVAFIGALLVGDRGLRIRRPRMP
jgi:hypothetical protein